MQKLIPVAMLVLTATILIGSSFGMAALAAKKADTVTVDNAKAIVIRNGQQEFVINVNSVPGAAGAKGDTGASGATGAAGANGTNGKDGAPGAPGATGDNGTAGAPGPKGDQGIPGTPGVNGTNGKDGVSTICIVQGNETCGLPGPVVPPVNGTGNVTHAAK